MTGFLVFGKSGQLATELARLLPDARFLGKDQVDLSDHLAVVQAIHDALPQVVINAAAYTAVDQAETETAQAYAVNAIAPGAMAVACAAQDIPLVHVSTDYVFGGQGCQPFHPDDPVAPLGVYGHSKAAGEAAIRNVGGAHAIIRTAWVFSAHGKNFVKTMLRLAQGRQTLNVVADQTGGPTPAASLAQVCLAAAQGLLENPGTTGTYHFSGTPEVTWAEFARSIFSQSGNTVTVNNIASRDYPTPAARPLNSRLDCTTTQQVFGIPRPDWRVGLSYVLQELSEQRPLV